MTIIIVCNETRKTFLINIDLTDAMSKDHNAFASIETHTCTFGIS